MLIASYIAWNLKLCRPLTNGDADPQNLDPNYLTESDFARSPFHQKLEDFKAHHRMDRVVTRREKRRALATATSNAASAAAASAAALAFGVKPPVTGVGKFGVAATSSVTPQNHVRTLNAGGSSQQPPNAAVAGTGSAPTAKRRIEPVLVRSQSTTAVHAAAKSGNGRSGLAAAAATGIGSNARISAVGSSLMRRSSASDVNAAVAPTPEPMIITSAVTKRTPSAAGAAAASVKGSRPPPARGGGGWNNSTKPTRPAGDGASLPLIPAKPSAQSGVAPTAPAGGGDSEALSAAEEQAFIQQQLERVRQQRAKARALAQAQALRHQQNKAMEVDGIGSDSTTDGDERKVSAPSKGSTKPKGLSSMASNVARFSSKPSAATGSDKKYSAATTDKRTAQSSSTQQQQKDQNNSTTAPMDTTPVNINPELMTRYAPLLHIDFHGRTEKKGPQQRSIIELGAMPMLVYRKDSCFVDRFIKLFGEKLQKAVNNVHPTAPLNDSDEKSMPAGAGGSGGGGGAATAGGYDVDTDPLLSAFWGTDRQTMTEQSVRLGVISMQCEMTPSFRQALVTNYRLRRRVAIAIVNTYNELFYGTLPPPDAVVAATGSSGGSSSGVSGEPEFGYNPPASQVVRTRPEIDFRVLRGVLKRPVQPQFWSAAQQQQLSAMRAAATQAVVDRPPMSDEDDPMAAAEFLSLAAVASAAADSPRSDGMAVDTKLESSAQPIASTATDADGGGGGDGGDDVLEPATSSPVVEDDPEYPADHDSPPAQDDTD